MKVPRPVNQPVRGFAPGTPERESLRAALTRQSSHETEIPLLIGGKEVRTGKTDKAVMPHRHVHVLATWHKGGAKEVTQAIQAALKAHADWSSWKFEDRAAIFLRAAELLATVRRDDVSAATMLNQSKTAHQSEIDAVCETIDFLRFNVHFADRIYRDQPLSPAGTWNQMDYRPLEGFVFAVTPFNFTSIAGNLPSVAALMGNTVVWKCASSTVYSNYQIAKVFEEAGLPPGVINFVPGEARAISDVVLSHPELAGVHFTGSTEVFQGMWRKIGDNIASYRTYPRLVGETGGKNFVLVHASGDIAAVSAALVRGGYEFQGQKCSAASRVYVPDSLWPRLRDSMVDAIQSIAMGDISNFRNFMGAVIDARAFEKITGYVEEAQHSADVEIVTGGDADDSEGFFIRPVLLRAKRPDYRTMTEEIFGPVVTVYVYPEKEWRSTLDLVNGTSPYGLTGAVFANDRKAIDEARHVLRFAAGNFYINDKPTGAVVGQQPFGGARASGTNDKAGSMMNLLRWVSARAIKETFVSPTDYRYPFMNPD
ncbi:MAG TPA: L-glutamate gamma-semialdehyde dehydrogenase [Terriglobia bacterium]|nr:L-glutamate gamma-semialdehyde dehydrogenase [Terriglobia bacterium]